MATEGSSARARITPAVAQASGMVAEQVGCSPDVALILMKKRAEVSGRFLDDIADAVLERRIRFS